MSKQYHIGEIAKALGVSNQTIRHYEDLGLLTSGRNEENQYRTYSTDDTRLLFQLSIYRSMGFSLKEIKELFFEKEPVEAQEMLVERISTVENEIAHMQDVLEELKEYQKGIEWAKSMVGKTWIDMEDKGFYEVLKGGSGYEIIGKKADVLLDYQKHTPFVRQAFCLTLDNLLSEEALEFQYGVYFKEKHEHIIKQHPNYEEFHRVMKAPYAVTVISIGQRVFSKEDFLHWFEQLNQMGYQPDGDVHGYAIYQNFSEDAQMDFVFAVHVKKK